LRQKLKHIWFKLSQHKKKFREININPIVSLITGEEVTIFAAIITRLSDLDYTDDDINKQ